MSRAQDLRKQLYADRSEAILAETGGDEEEPEPEPEQPPKRKPGRPRKNP